MGANADTVKGAYEAFGKGDLEGATAPFADDVVWENPEASQVPNNGKHEGKEAVTELLANVGSVWESFEIHPDQFVEDGDTVVVLSHAHAKGSAKEVKLPFVHVWQLSDGKVTEVLALTDTALAAEALGNI